QVRLARGRTRRDRAAVEREIEQICAPRWVAEVLTVTLTGTTAELRLRYRTDRHARRQLEDRIFGKRILFTNRTDWPVARVIAAYRSQSDIESGFRQLKDPQVISFS
ncbi:transposase, partial [Rhodococcus sp. WS4]